MPTRRKELPSQAYRTHPRFITEAKELGRCVRAHRQLRRWTLDQTAERTGLEFQHIQKIEAGMLNVTLITLVRLSEGFGVRVVDLFTAPAQPEVSASHP
jgi:transcriptional regulator with XRE-family HTH domain